MLFIITAKKKIIFNNESTLNMIARKIYIKKICINKFFTFTLFKRMVDISPQ